MEIFNTYFIIFTSNPTGRENVWLLKWLVHNQINIVCSYINHTKLLKCQLFDCFTELVFLKSLKIDQFTMEIHPTCVLPFILSPMLEIYFESYCRYRLRSFTDIVTVYFMKCHHRHYIYSSRKKKKEKKSSSVILICKQIVKVLTTTTKGRQ